MLLQEFLDSAGSKASGNGRQSMPPMSAFEAEISKFKAIQDEIQVQVEFFLALLGSRLVVMVMSIRCYVYPLAVLRRYAVRLD